MFGVNGGFAFFFGWPEMISDEVKLQCLMLQDVRFKALSWLSHSLSGVDTLTIFFGSFLERQLHDITKKGRNTEDVKFDCDVSHESYQSCHFTSYSLYFHIISYQI